MAFRGQLSQNFVVLNDDESPNPRAGPTPRFSGAPSGSGSSRGEHRAGGRAQQGSTDQTSRGTKRPGQDLTNDNRKK